MKLDRKNEIEVLVVEDNPNDYRLIERTLSGSSSAFLPAKVSVFHAGNLNEAADIYREKDIELVLLDLGLPESSGAETFERAKKKISNVPFVVLTGLKDEKTALQLLQEGAQDYINKDSISEENLVRSVRYAMEREEREKKLRESNERLEILNRILRHDIKNDVQVLIGCADILTERVDEENKTQVTQISRISQHILELTEDSRNFIETVVGDKEVESEPVSLDRMLLDEIEKARSRYPEAEFQIKGMKDGQKVLANEMLSSVFRNLINNAVQHHDGKPGVEIRIEEDGDEVRISVADDGPGVSDAEKRRIFGKGESQKEGPGIGIGLYLVKSLVEGYGGEVWIEDNEPSGAIFVTELRTP
ncbi:MAG: ATP-binding protein [Halobacteria archaeon]